MIQYHQTHGLASYKNYMSLTRQTTEFVTLGKFFIATGQFYPVSYFPTREMLKTKDSTQF